MASNPTREIPELRRALGTFATGVAIVTGRAPQGTLLGLTMNSFTSVSLDPPLVLWCLRRESKAVGQFKRSAFFAVHVLATDQEELSRRFAKGMADPFAGLEPATGLGATPLLEGVCARFECQRVSHADGGDHVIFVGQVQRFDWWERDPLLYYRGRYCALSEQDEIMDRVRLPLDLGHLDDPIRIANIGRPWG